MLTIAVHTKCSGMKFRVVLAVALVSSIAFAQREKEDRSDRSVRDGASRAVPEVVTLRSDERQLTFEYRPRFTPTKDLRDGGQAFTLQDFEGSVARYREESPEVRTFVTGASLWRFRPNPGTACKSSRRIMKTFPMFFWPPFLVSPNAKECWSPSRFPSSRKPMPPRNSFRRQSPN